MVPTLLLIIFYIGIFAFGFYQTSRLRDYLLAQNATDESTAIPVDRQKYFVLTIKFPFSAIQETPEALLYYDITKERSMLIFFGFIFIITLFSLLILLVSYL